MSVMVLSLHSSQCRQSDADVLQMDEVLERDPDALERRAEFSFCGQLTPLQSAVYRNHTVCVNFLIKKGANVNAVTGTGHHTALYIAIYRKYLNMVEILLEKGASTKSHLAPYTNAEKQLICESWYFHLAVTFEFLDIAKKLVEYGSNTEDFDKHTGNQILHAAEIAAAKPSPEVLLLALQYGPSIGERSVAKEGERAQGSSLVLCTVGNKWSMTSDVKVEKLKLVWTLLSKFGHSFWCTDNKGRNVQKVLERKRTKNSNINLPDSIFVDLLDFLEALMFNPLSLQDLCRIAVRSRLGQGAQQKINSIGSIPQTVQSFLKFELL
ncbi:ankyrin repeat and SOCS box protein 1-like [Cloeon dipterum]|uniref:ankyrin repeat and SOCS box protein 1-like n=1 Tax=Cloeon dipterum TaxID=197152 RepID=UPI00321F97CB